MTGVLKLTGASSGLGKHWMKSKGIKFLFVYNKTFQFEVINRTLKLEKPL